MNLDRVSPGKHVPEEINVVVEIPAHSDPVKYELDKETGAMFVDRFMTSSMHYPCNYGSVPHTLPKHGDPFNVLVITPFPLFSGSVFASPVSHPRSNKKATVPFFKKKSRLFRAGPPKIVLTVVPWDLCRVESLPC